MIESAKKNYKQVVLKFNENSFNITCVCSYLTVICKIYDIMSKFTVNFAKIQRQADRSFALLNEVGDMGLVWPPS